MKEAEWRITPSELALCEGKAGIRQPCLGFHLEEAKLEDGDTDAAAPAGSYFERTEFSRSELD